MHIDDIFSKHSTTLSFEFFPPKTEAASEKLYQAIQELEPYKPSFGKQTSPDCGHVYELSSAGEPGGTYSVTATSSWVITWEGAGQSGTIRLDGLQRSVEITVGEAQVLVE